MQRNLMINVQQGIKNNIYIYIYKEIEQLNNWINPESIRNFMKSGDLLKWIHKNGVMNFSVVIIYSVV